MALLLNIGFNNIIRHVATTTAKIASGAKAPTSIDGEETRNGAATYENFYLLTVAPSDWWFLRRGGKQMNVILGGVSFHDLDRLNGKSHESAFEQ